MPTSSHSAKTCANIVLEVVPMVMRTLRVEMRQHRAADLSVVQFRTLNYLNNHPGTSLSAAAEHIGLTLPAVSTLVDGLVERKLVKRGAAAGDRRRITLALTEPGQTALSATKAAAEAQLAQRLARLSPADCAVVIQAMQILRPLFAPEPPGAAVP